MASLDSDLAKDIRVLTRIHLEGATLDDRNHQRALIGLIQQRDTLDKLIDMYAEFYFKSFDDGSEPREASPLADRVHEELISSDKYVRSWASPGTLAAARHAGTPLARAVILACKQVSEDYKKWTDLRKRN